VTIFDAVESLSSGSWLSYCPTSSAISPLIEEASVIFHESKPFLLPAFLPFSASLWLADVLDRLIFSIPSSSLASFYSKMSTDMGSLVVSSSSI